MKLTKNTIAATFAALLIGGLSISPASAVPHQSGRVFTGTHTGTDVQGAIYVNPRSAPEGSQPIMKSNAAGRTNGRTG
jgi:hypothetical protein